MSEGTLRPDGSSLGKGESDENLAASTELVEEALTEGELGLPTDDLPPVPWMTGLDGGGPEGGAAPESDPVFDAVVARADLAQQQQRQEPDPGGEGAQIQELMTRFRTAGQDFAVPVRQVLEIVEIPGITRIPGLPPFYRGVAHLRGEMMAVIDLAVLLGSNPGRAGHLLIVRDGARALSAAFWVEQVLGVAPFHPDRLQPSNGDPDHPLAPFVLGVESKERGGQAVLDLSAFLHSPEVLPRGMTRELSSDASVRAIP